jgi:hypothetical protein
VLDVGFVMGRQAWCRTHMHTRMHTHPHSCTHAHMHVKAHPHVHTIICVHRNLGGYTCMHMHTHGHTQNRTGHVGFTSHRRHGRLPALQGSSRSWWLNPARESQRLPHLIAEEALEVNGWAMVGSGFKSRMGGGGMPSGLSQM